MSGLESSSVFNTCTGTESTIFQRGRECENKIKISVCYLLNLILPDWVDGDKI
jgi:hypothetical protein